MPEIIARSCCSRYFATSQPRLTVPTTCDFGTRDIVEEGFAERRIARDQQDRLGRHALRGHVEQDEADAVMFLGCGIGPHQAKNPVGVVGVRRPDLLAGDDVIVAVALGAGLQRGEVRSGVRLGIALAPADQARGDLRQMLLLLRLVAVLQQRRPEHPDAETRQRRAGADRRHFLAQHLVLGAIEPSAAIFLRPVRHGPALVAHPLEPDALRLGREFCVAPAPIGIVLRGHRTPHLRRAIGLQPGAGFTAECFQIGHDGVSMWDICIDLSRRIAEFNICLASAHAAPGGGHDAESGVCAKR